VPWRWQIQEDPKDPWLQIRISFVYGKTKEMLIGTDDASPLEEALHHHQVSK
jgi:hypothetical protein